MPQDPMNSEEPIQNPDIQPSQAAPIETQAPTENSLNATPNLEQTLPSDKGVVINPISPDMTQAISTISISPLVNQTVSQDSISAVEQQQVPSPAAAPLETSGAGPVKKSVGKATKIMIGIAAGVVLLGGSLAAAYTWYEQPSKVIADSIISAITSKTVLYTGTISTESDSAKLLIEVDGSSDISSADLTAKLTLTVDDKDYKVDGEALVDGSGDFYVKADNLNEIIDDVAESYLEIDSNSNTMIAIDSFVNKVNGKWIKISSEDLSDYSEEYSETQSCMSTVTDKLKNDKIAVSELTNLYDKNQFIIIDKELGQKDGNFGYSLKTDEDKLNSFIDGFESTVVYKTMHDCDDSFAIDASDYTTTGSENINLWVDAWTHQISRVEYSDSDDGTKYNASVDLSFNKEINVSAPSDSISLKDLQGYAEDVMNAYQQDMIDSYYSDYYDYDYNYYE